MNRQFAAIALNSLFSANPLSITDTPIGSSRGRSASLTNYNVVWDSPYKDYIDSVPIGNGDVVLNECVEVQKDLPFYIVKTDSWVDKCRFVEKKLLKEGFCAFKKSLWLIEILYLFLFDKDGIRVKTKLLITPSSDMLSTFCECLKNDGIDFACLYID